MNPEAPVLVERVGAHVLLVTINRPHKRNAIDVAAATALAAALRQSEQDTTVRAVVLTGSGARCFCAGADLADIAAGLGPSLTIAGDGLGGLVFAARSKPWIAAVRGMAVGGGLELVLSCDMLVASEDASFALPEVQRGLLAGAGGAYRAPRALPRAVALEMLLTGDPLSALRAHALGMVNHLLPDGEVSPGRPDRGQCATGGAGHAGDSTRRRRPDRSGAAHAHGCRKPGAVCQRGCARRRGSIYRKACCLLDRRLKGAS